MRARQMNGIASQVKIDEHGNRFGDYSLLAMDSKDTSANKYKFKVRSQEQTKNEAERKYLDRIWFRQAKKFEKRASFLIERFLT